MLTIFSRLKTSVTPDKVEIYAYTCVGGLSKFLKTTVYYNDKKMRMHFVRI